jgi:hypothetical protein
MMKSPVGAACASVLIALAGGLATPMASHAAVYGGVFDPENANYKWFGNHLFEVDDACLIGDGWKKVNAEPGYGDGSYCGSASLIGSDLTVVNKLGNLANPGIPVSKTLQFADPAFDFIPNTSDVWGVNIVGGQLVGIDTFEIGDFIFSDDNPLDPTHGGQWQLRWTSGRGDYCLLYFGESCGFSAIGALGAFSASPMNDPLGPRPDVILTNSIAGTNAALPQGTTTFSLQRRDLPEPTTVTLVLAALGAGWLSRRRIKR